MASNTFGKKIQLTTFGESHGPAIGGVIDGFPAGIDINMDYVNHKIALRKSKSAPGHTSRHEDDKIELLSGVFEGKSTGAPLAFLFRNTNQKSSDYDLIKDVFRPSHADYVYYKKYGHYDHRGGGRASARETVVRVAAGAFCQLFLRNHKINVSACVSKVGNICLPEDVFSYDFEKSEKDDLRCPDKNTSLQMQEIIMQASEKGDSVGSMVACKIEGLPAGIGEPLYDKFHARLAYAVMSINAARSFELGAGANSVGMYGSEHNDPFSVNQDGTVSTTKNDSGGVQAGITNGMNVNFLVAFKPPSSVRIQQSSLDKNGRQVNFSIPGRHDSCLGPRAAQVVEAMAALVCADFLMMSSTF